MEITTAQLLAIRKSGASIEAADEEEDEDESEEVTMEQLMGKFVEAHERLAAALAKPQAAPTVHVAAPRVEVAAPKVAITNQPEPKSKRYECDCIYDRNGDLTKLIITAE